MVNDGEYMLIVGACWCLIDKPFVNPYKDNSNLVACSDQNWACEKMSRNHRGWWLLQKTTVQSWHSTCVNNVFLDVIAETKKNHILQRIITVYYCNKLDLGVSYLWTKPHRCFDCIDDYNCFGSEFKSKKTLDLSSAQLSCNLVAAMAPVIWINLDQFDTNQPMKWGSERRWTVGPKNWMIPPPSGLEDNSFL